MASTDAFSSSSRSASELLPPGCQDAILAGLRSRPMDCRCSDQRPLSICPNIVGIPYHILVSILVDVRSSMGTENGGNMFPGVARPFGMTKLGRDNQSDIYETGG